MGDDFWREMLGAEEEEGVKGEVVKLRLESSSWLAPPIALAVSERSPISGSTKGSIQVRYSTKLKDRMGTPKRVSKRRRVE